MKIDPIEALKLAAAGLAAWMAWRAITAAGRAAEKAVETAADVLTHQLNPASSDNLINQALEGAGSYFTGNPNWTLGGSIYDFSHSDLNDPTKNTLLEAINPAADGNLINRGVSNIGQAITGQSNWTLGGWLYDVTH